LSSFEAVSQPVRQRVESAPRPVAVIRMKPGANTAIITKRKYQMMDRVHTGLTKDPYRR
jgi:hypothetical protein